MVKPDSAINKNIPAEQPLVSVVMCTYNCKPYAVAAVNCIVNQTYTNWELIISDDGSIDSTREWLQSLQDSRIKVFLQEKNLGYVCNKNFVHRQAAGKYITQLDGDDLSAPDRLEKQVAVVLRHPDIKIVGTGYHRIDDKGTILETLAGEKDKIITNYTGSYPFWFPSLLVHKSVFDVTGYFDEFFSGVYGDDLYWTVRANEKFPIYFIKDPLYTYRNNPGSVTNVLNDKRKLIVVEIVAELLYQRKQRGTDWLEQGDYKALQDFEWRLLQNKKFIAEKYRIWASKAVDKRDFSEARKLLKASFSKDAFNTLWYRTFFYYIRKKIYL